MTKYKVYLADNYKSERPFTSDWSYELLGDKLRGEFDVYFEKQEQLASAGSGQTNQLIKGEYVKRFMITKHINLVDDAGTGTLKSVFILKPGEKKEIDERAMQELSLRFKYEVKTFQDGTKSSPVGFMKFEMIGESAPKSEKEDETLQVTGNDIQYFEEESQKEVEKEVFACDKCEKEFDSKKALSAHKLSHKESK